MNVLGIREEAGSKQDQLLMDDLHDKALLLILDNCEHLLPEVAQLAETMLCRAHRVRILATSREKLGASGETIWCIPPLSTPDSKGIITFENMMQYEAVQLFRDRAAATRANFTITRKNANAVAQICARLDGLPLAIELAAARVRVLSVEEIVTRLEDRFRLLVGSRTVHSRQQTLHALVDWSYGLLTDKERILLRRLSVFSGSWTLEAAEQVCSDGKMEAWEVLDLLTSLIDKSFVNGETQNGHIHYCFLETIQQFSQERLSESNETDEFAQKHASYYLKMAETSYGKMWGPDQAIWLVRLDEEYDNLRKALSWLSQVTDNKTMIVQMAGSLWRIHRITGAPTG
jgi:predicted ATPase